MRLLRLHTKADELSHLIDRDPTATMDRGRWREEVRRLDADYRKLLSAEAAYEWASFGRHERRPIEQLSDELSNDQWKQVAVDLLNERLERLETLLAKFQPE